MLLTLYRGLTRAANPLLPRLLARRARRGKELPERRAERLGRPQRPRPAGRLLWLHGASVGESLSALGLIGRLLARHPGLAVLVTTGTVTSARMMERRLPPGAFHQFVPLDTPGAARRFLGHWRPDAVLWLESELWPNLLGEVRRRGIPAALLNARMSARSFRRWRLAPGTARRLLSGFRLVLPWSEQDGGRFAALGAAALGPAGNLKFAAEPPAPDPAARAALAAAIGGRPVWLAASTHPGEEEACLAAHAAAAQRHPDLLTIVAPRQPARGPAIAALAEAAGLRCALRSSGALPEGGDAVHIADTLGEMGTLLSLAPVAFIGGSLVAHGGHNPIEAAQHGAAILYGPHMTNFTEIAAALEGAGGAWRVDGPDALPAALCRLLDDPAARRALAAAAASVIAANRHVLDRALAALAPLLDPVLEEAG